jgi:hypothetical protein
MEAATDASLGVISASVLLGAFTLKLVDFIKYLKNGDANGLLSLGLTWIAGFVAVQVFVETQWGDEVMMGRHSLDQLDTVSKIVLGLVVPTVASLLYDAKKAVDRTDSASTPRLTREAEVERQARLARAFGS